LLKDAATTLDVRADIRVSVPIGAGYGTSAAGTAAACLALTDAADIPMTLNELGRLTHIAEVVNHTGLGTASALLVGGFVLVTEPGAPGIGSVDRLLFPKNHKIICVYVGPILTRGALSQADLARRVNPLAQRAMQAIRRTPDLQTFLMSARKFSDQAGFQTPKIARIMDVMTAAGAVGGAQNMIGEAVHAVAETSKIPRVVRAVRREFPSAKVFVTQLEDRGVRLSEKGNPKH
jgi:pantoate kinase